MAQLVDFERGRKVIFLYPPDVLADELIPLLARQEYELYVVRDHARLKTALPHPELRKCLLFVSTDEVLSEGDWLAWVRDIRESPFLRDVRISILSYNEDPALAAKYLMDIEVQGGFINLGLGREESTRIILATLAATEAKGQRRYVRVECSGIVSTSVEARIGGRLCGARLLDLSSAGMALIFDSDPGLQAGAELEEVQLRLGGAAITLAGSVAGMRQSNAGRIYVVLFARPHPEPVRDKLLRFVHDCLQARMARILESGPPRP